MNDDALLSYVTEVWDRDIVPTLEEYIRIPNVSPVFEADWASLGHMQRAVDLLAGWSRARDIPGLTVEVHEIEGRTPVIFMEIPPANGGAADDTVLLYGHLDKQPELFGWRDGLGPWEPVIEGDHLYGRGGADDGYSTFASLTAIEAAQAAGFAHTRCVVLIEASEESGSRDLPAHIEALQDRIGTPSLVICLDSGCADYDHLWITTSLRGLLAGQLDVAITSEGVHSGEASGVIPSTFRIARQLLSRIEDEDTGEIRLEELHADIPEARVKELEGTADVLNKPLAETMPFLTGARPVTDDPRQQLINHTWRPMLEITGADGLPPCDRAGNVLRASTSLYLSLRLPPTRNALEAEPVLTDALTADPPYGAHVAYRGDKHSQGWNAPAFAPWLWDSLQRASEATFGTPAYTFGEGGTISFMAMLGEKFPQAQFAVTGVLGPGSNAHGPNEFLHLPTGRKLTAALAHLLRDHAARPQDTA
ncbi:MAG TPA: M20/M25/M40 family metallo-hydrolase [Acidimicrobiales bacterium]|nr:M20/M25/M40 family metallo-hydrolase [Acidimicrobiales bacterium]